MCTAWQREHWHSLVVIKILDILPVCEHTTVPAMFDLKGLVKLGEAWQVSEVMSALYNSFVWVFREMKVLKVKLRFILMWFSFFCTNKNK